MAKHAGKILSVIVVPHSCGRSRGISISRREGLIFSLVLVLGLFLAIFGAISLFKFGILGIDERYLVSENRRLKEELKAVQKELSDIKLSLSTLSQRNHEIAAMLDLPVSDNVYGVGGAQMNIDENRIRSYGSIAALLDSLKIALFVEKRVLEDSYRELSEQRELLSFTPTIKPVNGYLTAGFGMRIDPFTGSLQPHEGVDLACPRGTPVRVTALGVVKFAGYYRGYGKLVIVKHGSYYETWYAHLNTIKVAPGDRVKRGDIIGTVGNTGYATGTHLHYEVHIGGKPTNPLNYFYPELVVD